MRFEARGDGNALVRVEHFGWGDGERWNEARVWHERACGTASRTSPAVVGEDCIGEDGAYRLDEGDRKETERGERHEPTQRGTRKLG